MGDKQQDVPENVQKLFLLKQKQRAEQKAYFQKYVTNPHRPINEGSLFDPAISRFSSLTAYQIEHFRPTAKSYMYFLMYMFIPCALLYTGLRWESKHYENKIRNGEIAYADRKFKLMY